MSVDAFPPPPHLDREGNRQPELHYWPVTLLDSADRNAGWPGVTLRKARRTRAAFVQSRVKEAIETARAAARKIVTAGETGAAEIDLQAIHTARTDFLDLDSDTHEVAAPSVGARTIDLAPSDEISAPIAPSVPALEQ